jgi:hypothetical protein
MCKAGSALNATVMFTPQDRLAIRHKYPKTPMQPTRSPLPRTQTDGLLGFNQQLIDQALALVAVYQARCAPGYAGPVGAHLRHVIEHYEALVFPAAHGAVDYDSRGRDRALERSPALARERLLAVRAQLGAWAPRALHMSVQVHGQAGTDGAFDFAVASSMERELVFLASHTVHHFALLAPHCQQHGIPTPADFGQAPSTVAHTRATSAIRSLHHPQETSCFTTPLPA